jgi:hypothetical protein
LMIICSIALTTVLPRCLKPDRNWSFCTLL